MASRWEELSSLMVRLAGPREAEWILLMILLSPLVSWNKVKRALVNTAKFNVQMLQVPSNGPALQVECVSAGVTQGQDPGSDWLLLWSYLNSPGPGTRKSYEGINSPKSLVGI